VSPGDSQPLLTALVVTFNHAAYIEDALRSVLDQETDFEVEVIVSEDCSTDDTRRIARGFAEANPDRVRLLLSEHNLNDNSVVRRGLEAARGRYVALLDGDDFWTCPTKLQRQVDLLEGRPDCSACFHNVEVIYEGEPCQSHPFHADRPAHRLWAPTPKPVSTLADLARRNFIQTCSVVFRTPREPLPLWYDGLILGDWPLHVLNAQRGNLAYLPELMATYRVHPGGFWSTNTSKLRRLEDVEALVAVYDALDRHLGLAFHEQMNAEVAALYQAAANSLRRRGEAGPACDCARKALRRLPPTRRARRLRLVRPPEWKPPGARGEAAVPHAGAASGESSAPDGWRGRLIALARESRYRWAEGLARDREVLDVGCGVGQGTSVLARAGARRALGVDVSPDAIDEAREGAGDLAEFVVGDLYDLPCEDRSFDLVTCFATIEQVADRDRVLDELRRVLRPDGLLLVSFPNPDVHTPGDPLHVDEHRPAELEEALAARFAHTRLYPQRNHLASVICGDETPAVASLDQQNETDVRPGVASVAGEEVYMVAAASDAPLPSLPSVGVLAEVIEVKSWYERALAWEERALMAEAWTQAHKAARDAAELELERLAPLHRRELKRTRRSLRKTKGKLKQERRRRRKARRRARGYEKTLSWRLTGPVRVLLDLPARRGLVRRSSPRGTRAPSTADNLTGRAEPESTASMGWFHPAGDEE